VYLFLQFRSLLDGLDDPILEYWRDIINLQRHWIGECNGKTLEFELEDNSSQDTKTLTIFTTNPEYACNAAFIAVAPGNILDPMAFGCDSTVNSNSVFKRLSVQAKSPFTGENLPIYVTNRVECDEGTDCHLGIPGISETDTLFAEAVNIPLSSPRENDKQINSVGDESCKRTYHSCGTGAQDPCGSKLQYWLISCQCYWGTTIPIVYCEHCNGPQPVPYCELPVILPTVDKLSSRGKSPLLEATDWLITKCPKYVTAI